MTKGLKRNSEAVNIGIPLTDTAPDDAVMVNSAERSPAEHVDDSILFKRAHSAALESIVSRHAPPGFLLSAGGDVVHIFGNAGELIPVQSGVFSESIIDLIHPDLKVIVTTALDLSNRAGFTNFKRSACIKGELTTATSYVVSLVPIELAGDALRFYLLSIEKVSLFPSADIVGPAISDENVMAYGCSSDLQQRISILENDLRSSKESLQSTIEKLEISNEELQRSNEELKTSNEQIKSTNENLHSVNEELFVTVDHNYRTAIDDLFGVFCDESLQTNQKIEHMLGIGLEYYRLDSAQVSVILGDSYEVKYAKSKKGECIFYDGSVIPLSNTFSSQLTDTNSVLAVDNIAKSDMQDLACYKTSGTESFVGALVQTTTGPFGSVCFYSEHARGLRYTAQDENFLLFLSSWIGLLLGNQERMAFVNNQNDYYQSLIESVPAMLFLCDHDGLIISASRRLCSKLGTETDELAGKNCHELLNVDNPSDLRKALENGKGDRMPFTVSLINGSTMDVEINISIKTVGSLHGVRMIVLTDVSERNRVSKNLENQNRLLESANINLNKFAFVASHDLQEPLRKIQQFSSFLEEDLKEHLTEDSSYHLNVVVDSSNRMSTLIYDLLQFSRATQEEPKIETVSIGPLVHEVISSLEIPIKEAKAIIDIGTLPTVQGDKGMLTQLFVNLIVNSIKYRDLNRPLTISVAGVGSEFKNGIIIADNGIGFEMEFAKRIFEPFNRLHRGIEYKGNGIGLAICSTVCDKHGWQITANSEPDAGSTFTIDFHLKKNRNAATQEKASAVNGG